jgi:hypothetical protein
VEPTDQDRHEMSRKLRNAAATLASEEMAEDNEIAKICREAADMLDSIASHDTNVRFI